MSHPVAGLIPQSHAENGSGFGRLMRHQRGLGKELSWRIHLFFCSPSHFPCRSQYLWPSLKLAVVFPLAWVLSTNAWPTSFAFWLLMSQPWSCFILF